jgi:hypothetical protein
MNNAEYRKFRLRLGEMVMAQWISAEERGDNPQDDIPEIIAALLSLAAMIARNYTEIGFFGFVKAAALAAEQERRRIKPLEET